MKVVITVTLDVDETEWREEYRPVARTQRELRDDIKSYFTGQITNSYPVDNGIATVVN